MIVNLANKKLLAPRIGLQWLSSIPNVDEYIKEMEEYGHIFCARYGGDEFIIIYDAYKKEFPDELDAKKTKRFIPFIW